MQYKSLIMSLIAYKSLKNFINTVCYKDIFNKIQESYSKVCSDKHMIQLFNRQKSDIGDTLASIGVKQNAYYDPGVLETFFKF